MIKIGVLVSGGGTNLQAIIDYLKNNTVDARIDVVVSNKADAYALERAKNNGIDTMCISKKDYPDGGFEDVLISVFKERNIDLIVLAGFMLILDKGFIDAFENRIINIHPALIPSFSGKGFYGLRVHKAALEMGVKITGATVHFVSAEADAGPIILQKAVEVLDDDTPEILQRRVMEQAEWKIFPEAIRLFAENRLVVENGRVRILDK